MKRKSFGRDRGLTLRILATSGLLGLLYLAFALVLINLLNVGLAAMLVIVLGLAAVQYWTSDKLALAAAGGQGRSPRQGPAAPPVRRRPCPLGGPPKPRVAPADNGGPNPLPAPPHPEHAAAA